jgi:Circadian oscillating protein COP23
MKFHTINVPRILLIPLLSIASTSIMTTQDTTVAKPLYYFECSRDTKTGFFNTIIKDTSSSTSKNLIVWKSKFINHPRETCNDVSAQFQLFFDRGDLDHLKIGISHKNGKSVVCGLSARNKDLPCDKNNQLFELSKSITPIDAYNGLLKNLKTKNNTDGIIQASSDEIIIDFRELILQL